MEKINVAELLCNCPKGMELDCTVFNGKICFEGFDHNNSAYPIKISVNLVNIEHLNIYGQYNTRDYAKCVIFPKGKTTWEGFVPPCMFKDGDILFVKGAYSWVLIYKESENKEDLHKYVAIPIHPNHTYIVYDNNPLCCKEDVSEIRFATEEEKQKLFKAIKDNGYKWNEATKKLEKLIEPKFKVGDRVKHISAYTSGIVVKVDDKGYHIDYPKGEGVCYINFTLEKDYELAPNKFDITTLKPFESMVLVRNSYNGFWQPTFWGIYEAEKANEHQYRNYLTTKGFFRHCIPYNDDTKHLLGTTNDCDEYYKTWE